MKKSLPTLLLMASAISAFGQSPPGNPGGGSPNNPPKTLNPADPNNWLINLDCHKIIEWCTVNFLGLPETGSYDSHNQGGGALPASVFSNANYDAYLKNKVIVTTSATWVGLGAAPMNVRMAKSASGEAEAYGGTLSLDSGIGLDVSYYSYNGTSFGMFGGTKYFQMGVGGESGGASWTTKANASCSGSSGSAFSTASASASLAEVSCRLISNVETSYFKQAEMQPGANVLLSWGQNFEDSYAAPFSVNGGGAVFEIIVTANHSGVDVPHTWELHYDGEGSPGHPPEQPPTPATTQMSEIEPGKWRLTWVMTPQQYSTLDDSPKDFHVNLIGHYTGGEGEFTRTWDSTIKIHANHTNWRQVGNDIFNWVVPSESQTTWPSPFVVRESGSGKIRWSWGYPLITIINETISGNEILNFFDNIGVGTKYIGLAKKAAILAKSAAVEPSITDEQLNFNDLFEKDQPFEPGAPVSTYNPSLNPSLTKAAQRSYYIMNGAHREFKFKTQIWRGDEYGQHGYIGLAPGRTEKYTGQSWAVGNFVADTNAGGGGSGPLPN